MYALTDRGTSRAERGGGPKRGGRTGAPVRTGRLWSRGRVRGPGPVDRSDDGDETRWGYGVGQRRTRSEAVLTGHAGSPTGTMDRPSDTGRSFRRTFETYVEPRFPVSGVVPPPAPPLIVSRPRVEREQSGDSPEGHWEGYRTGEQRRNWSPTFSDWVRPLSSTSLPISSVGPPLSVLLCSGGRRGGPPQENVVTGLRCEDLSGAWGRGRPGPVTVRVRPEDPADILFCQVDKLEVPGKIRKDSTLFLF